MIAPARAAMQAAYSVGDYVLAAAIAMVAECGYCKIEGLTQPQFAVIKTIERAVRAKRYGSRYAGVVRKERTAQPVEGPKAAKIAPETPKPIPTPSTAKKTEKKRPKTRFSPPSVAEVEEYCRERANGVDAQMFVDFYTAKGWVVGKSAVKDWRACVRTWERREPSRRPRGATLPKHEEFKLSF